MIKEQLLTFTRKFVADNTIGEFIFDEKILFKNFNQKEKDALIFLWNKYGLTSFNSGKLRLIDPLKYRSMLKGFEGVTEEVVPFMRTALGAFFTWDYLDGEWVILYLDVHNNEYNFMSDHLIELLRYSIVLDMNWVEDLNGELENIAVDKFPNLEEDEMVSFEPALVLGGDESPDNMVKVKLEEQLYFLSQIHDQNT